jgi:hypothetical protein
MQPGKGGLFFLAAVSVPRQSVYVTAIVASCYLNMWPLWQHDFGLVSVSGGADKRRKSRDAVRPERGEHSPV